MEHVSYLGVLLGMIAYAVSVSPSLLPRRWWWHAFVSGTLTGVGYVIGWGLETAFFAAGRALEVQIVAPVALKYWVKIIVFVGVALWTLRAVILSYIDSRRAAALVDMKPVKVPEYLLGLASSALMFGVVYQISEWILAVYNATVNLLSRWVYTPVAVLISVAIVIVIFLVVSNKVVFKSVLAVFAYKAGQLNTTSGGGYTQPLVPQWSGSPKSLSPWDTIGGQGRKFLTLGPTAEEIEAVTGRPAMQPIRAYAGMPRTNSDLEPIADLVIEELKRTGGFDRSVIVVNTTTGSGWVDEWLIQPVEYLTGGDCATASMQYSYLFSAALLVTTLDPCAQAGQILFEKVLAEVEKKPKDKRPLIYVTGESLGSYGSQAAFSDIEDALDRADGAVWVGSPNYSRLWRALTKERYPGSPEVAPVYDAGSHVRFVNNPSQLTHDIYGRKLDTWQFPRVVFVQHASDPVVWYNVPLMWQEPDWLRERDGLDVTPLMRYTPGVTYLQVIADLPVAGSAPAGHGHTYHRELLDVWYYMLGFDLDHPKVQTRYTPRVDPVTLDAVAEAIRHAVEPRPLSKSE